MEICALEGYSVQGPAIGGGIVRRFDRPPAGMFVEPEYIAATGIVQWLEREGDDWGVRATIVVTASADWSKQCALATVFDSFLQKIN